jgi:glycosyltransferase involved in cell wall biosynthesis
MMRAGERGGALCMVVHAYYPTGEPRVQREARAARDSGRRLTVVCLRQDGEPAREQVDGVEVQRLPLRHARGASVSRLIFEYLSFAVLATVRLAPAALRRRYKTIQVHAPPDFLVVAGLLPKLRGARLLLDIHDLSPHMYGARFGGPLGALAARVLQWVELLACRLADDVLTVHEPYRCELSAHGVSTDKVTVVMNSVDDVVLERARAFGNTNGRLAAGANRFSADAGEEAGFLLAYHGTLTHWYGVDLLLEALDRLRDQLPSARAIILGAGDALIELRALTADRGLVDRVAFSGAYLPIEETLARVAGASCGVIPNRPSTLNRFALSSKLFEYVALGVPVAVSRLQTLEAHFASDEVTFFEPGNAESLAEAVLWIANHQVQARDKATRASQRARQYSWDQNRQRYLALLEP